jgi:DHA1 family tetracycline resistance protein-like MFS transporter
MDPRLPFWVAAGLSFANTLYGFLILPESLAPDRRARFRWHSANPLGALGLLRSDPVLTGLSVVNFFAQLAHVVLPSTFVLYATISIWLGREDRRSDARHGRDLRHGGAGRSDRADR